MPRVAHERQSHGRAAVLVLELHRHVAVGQVAVTPLHERDQGRIRGRSPSPSAGTRAAAAPRRPGRARAAGCPPRRGSEPVGQHRPRRPEDALEVGEPAHAEERLAEHQEAPLLPHHRQRARDRTAGPVPQRLAHENSINLLSSLDEPRSREQSSQHELREASWISRSRPGRSSPTTASASGGCGRGCPGTPCTGDSTPRCTGSPPRPSAAWSRSTTTSARPSWPRSAARWSASPATTAPPPTRHGGVRHPRRGRLAGLGLGRQLLGELIALAAARGIAVLTATVQPDNDRVLALIRRVLPDTTVAPDDDVLAVRSLLPVPARR